MVMRIGGEHEPHTKRPILDFMLQESCIHVSESIWNKIKAQLKHIFHYVSTLYITLKRQSMAALPDKIC